jgi:AcrR family transcriptional regulator
MSRNVKRRLQKPERRRVIEDAASALFAANGYAETRLEDIAAAAGVTKQLLYQHFRSKRELHMALLAEHRDGLIARLSAGMSAAGPLAERMRRTLDDWFAYVEENRYASAMLFRDTTGDPVVQAFYRELQASARAANVALLLAESELHIPREAVEPTAEFVRAGVVGVALWWSEHPDVPRALVVDAAFGVLAGRLGIADE